MNKVYASSDWHGQLDLANKILDYLDDTDKLYYLGDAIDRGDGGIKIMDRLLNDKRVVYLIGNHEDIMRKTIRHVGSTMLWENNGGGRTMHDCKRLPKRKLEHLLGCIDMMPREEVYTNKSGKKVHLSHAGTHFGWSEFSWSQRGYKDSFLWNRVHFDMLDNGNHTWDYIVHGHTPTIIAWAEQYIIPDDENLKMTEQDPVILKYCGGRKVDIDTGCFFTNTAALLDLDTMEPIYFKQEEKKDEHG